MEKNINFHKKLILTGILLVSFFISAPSVSADNIGDESNFFVNSEYDEFSRNAASVTLRHVSNRAYFYVDDRYWAGLDQFEKNDLTTDTQELARQFDQFIYDQEVGFFGSEPNPGVDGDPKITILLEDLKRGVGGYFETANLYRKELVDTSNEREMVVVNVDSIEGNGKNYLAHEFQHLLSFNQKELIRDISEDVWLNELRSEYAVTWVGYNSVFNGSNLDRRLDSFLSDPSDSLTEWPNTTLDYGHAAVFAEYLTEQFGPQIISETMKLYSGGIGSLNQYFQSKNIQDNFSNVFGRWLAANYLNDSNFDSRLGYKREGLRDFRITPQQYTLAYPESYTLEYDLEPWEGSWHKLNLYYMPEGKAVKVDFNSERGFNLWYIDNQGNFGSLPDGGVIPNKGGLTSVVLMPVNESETSRFTKDDPALEFSANIQFVDAPTIGASTVSTSSTLKNGDLIKRSHEPETYVIEGKYKRYLRPEVIALYGHLNPANAIELDGERFNSFTTANYVRNVSEERVFAVWPDGTKHWLNITEAQFIITGRDAGSIFTINDLELNYYATGPDITR